MRRRALALPLLAVLSLSAAAIVAAAAPVTAMADRDPLKAINDELRRSDAEATGPWLPLESNPEVFTSFGRRVGLHSSWGFVDVFGVSRGPRNHL
jgi:hypothetical protein